MWDLHRQTKEFTNKDDEQDVALLMTNFWDNLEKIGKPNSEGKLQIYMKKFKDVIVLMERTDLFCRKAIMVRFAMYSQLGIMHNEFKSAYEPTPITEEDKPNPKEDKSNLKEDETI